ncbi:MAG: hypothetical protein IJX04_07945, partial [Oscillospiraceae bacterium]|nr:hypothetical protein [Oscillospiraceae bacterium]
MKNTMTKRVLSIVLCLALLMAYLPAGILAAELTVTDRVADPSTMDGWKDYFLPDPLTTENAGGVWTDKSVFTDASAFADTGITKDGEDSFLVALSAMGSSMSVTGMSNTPTDTMMILDLSSSMYQGSQRNPETIRTMLQAVNNSITKLQNLNEHNRVGVTVYFGGQNRIQSDSSNSMVLLPLDRYTHSSGAYLKANVSGGKLQSVAVNSNVKNSAGKTMAQTKRTVTNVAGTYAQLGILDAMNQFLAADTIVPATADYQANVTRVPVFIFMSDGEPTAATHQYTKKVNAGMGNNTVSIRSPQETDFVTQLTAAYAREMVDAHYVATEPLFYSLSLGYSVSLAVMDPANHTSNTIDSYWTKLLNNGSASITVYNSPDGWSSPTVKKTYTVKTTTVDGAIFPSSKNQRSYVDKTFTAATAGALTDAFDNIVNQINLVSRYTPTLVDQNDELSGYISFVDKVGQYMSVTDIKGILIDDTLFSGADLASNFVAGGGNLGTYEDPKPLGDEMVWAVQARLGIKTAAEARTLIGLAYQYGQLSYTSPTEYSNYIGWYANAAGEYVGFWHEGIQTMPAATGDVDTDPVYIVKSYGYLGEVDEAHGVSETDMMYATVQIRKEIATGEETVAFAVPAALIPLLTYQVELDENGNVDEFTVSGAEHPIRLVYEVALDSYIDAYNLTETVSADYLAANTNADGSVSFYTNQYEADNTTGYGKVNTYSYFNPSRENDKYYYTEDAPVYTDTNGTLYTGDTQPSGTFYRAYKVYEKNRIHVHYRQFSDAALATAKQADDGSWYIGTGNVHVNMDGYTVDKSDNTTGTLTYANQPFVDAHNHSVGDTGYSFVVGATLGNNGKLNVAPATGIVISKTMAAGATAPTEAFQFVVSGPTEGKVDARLVKADGTESDTTVTFSAGKAYVSLNAGEKLYISGLTAGKTYTVEEIPTVGYVPDRDSVTVTVEAGRMAQAAFVNADRGTGNLTVTKKINHNLGSGYIIPGKSFTILVDLDGIGVESETFTAEDTDGTVTSITTDEEGRFTVELGHDDQFEVYGLPAGTVATVTELTPGPGFTASYWEEGAAGDGIVTVPKGGTASVTVINDYAPASAPVNVVLKGVKTLTTAAADWNGKVFAFQLQKRIGQDWQTIATATANEADPTFDFSAAMQGQIFDAPGTYHYQVIETNGGSSIDGITYDATLHTFGVVVSDLDMDGELEIDAVISYHTGREFAINANGDWEINVSFTNVYEADDVTLFLDIQKELINLSGSPLVDRSGYQFGLYKGDDLLFTSERTDGVGEARMILHYTLADEGTHSYTLKEIVPDAGIPGMIYAPETYTVTVKVVDNADGTISASVVSILRDGDQKSFEIPVFTNTYEPKPTELAIDFVSKKLTGRDLEPGEFTFELREGTNGILQGANA